MFRAACSTHSSASISPVVFGPTRPPKRHQHHRADQQPDPGQASRISVGEPEEPGREQEHDAIVLEDRGRPERLGQEQAEEQQHDAASPQHRRSRTGRAPTGDERERHAERTKNSTEACPGGAVQDPRQRPGRLLAAGGPDVGVHGVHAEQGEASSDCRCPRSDRPWRRSVGPPVTAGSGAAVRVPLPDSSSGLKDDGTPTCDMNPWYGNRLGGIVPDVVGRFCLW